MSYTFQVQGADPEAAIAAAIAKIGEIVSYQPEHLADRAAIISAVEGACRALERDPNSDVVVRACGSVGWTASPGQEHIRSVDLSLAVYRASRDARQQS